MAKVEDILVSLELRMDGYERDLRRAERDMRSATDRMGGAVDELEREIKSSSSAIGTAFGSIAVALAAAFSTSKITEFADAYTRFTNNLRVSGLEGQALADVQERLFDIAQQNAVELESVGTLYGRAAMSARELGASQEQLLQFTRAVSAGLKIQGTSAAEAQGAMLQLGQALGGGTVRAEEFNSIVEGMLPIAQAMANNIDAAGGSVARLRTLVNDGKVSSQQAFAAIIASMSGMEQQAANTAMTIGQAFTQLDNALGRYIGQTDASLGASQRLAEAIGWIAQNLDFFAKAIATIAVALVTRYAVGTAAAFIGTSRLIASLSNFTAASLGAAGSATTLGVMMARLGAAATGAGAAILRAFGGPIGLAITGIAAAFIFLGDSTDEATEAQERQEEQQRRLSAVQAQAADIASRLASASREVRAAAMAEAAALRATTIQTIALARAQLFLAQAKRAALTIGQVGTYRYGGPDQARMRRGEQVPMRLWGQGAADRRGADAAVADATANLQSAMAAADALADSLAPPAVGGGVDEGRGRGGGGSRGSADDTARRERQWLDMRDRARIEELQAQQELETGIEVRAAGQRKIAEYEHDIAMRAIDANSDLSDARKEELRVIERNIAATRQQVINTEVTEALSRQRLEAVQTTYDNEIDLARAQMAFAETRDERLGLELRLLDLQHGALKAEQVAIRDNANLSEEARNIARDRIAVLERLYGLEQRQLQRAAESPGQRFLRELGRETRNQSDRFEEIAIDGLDSLNDGLVDAIMNTKSLGEVFKNIANQIIADLLRIAIRQAIIQPLANQLFGGGDKGGGGGILGSLMGLFGGVSSKPGGMGVTATGMKLPGFASGGSMMIGGRGGMDQNILSLNGQPVARVSRGERMDIVPPSAISGVHGGGGAPVKITLEVGAGEYFDARVSKVAGPIASQAAVEVVHVAAPRIAKAAENEVYRRANRRLIGG